MTDKITSITGGKRHPEPDYKPNQDVIDILEMALEEAKKAERKLWELEGYRLAKSNLTH